jgi:hypothetical protein
MNEAHNPTAGFWATVVVVSTVVLYPLSFGPACWLNQRTGAGRRLMSIVYRPIIWLASESSGAETIIGAYASLGAADNDSPVFRDGEVHWASWEAEQMQRGMQRAMEDLMRSIPPPVPVGPVSVPPAKELESSPND